MDAFSPTPMRTSTRHSLWSLRRSGTAVQQDEEAVRLVTGLKAQAAFVEALGFSTKTQNPAVEWFHQYLAHHFANVAPPILNVLSVTGISETDAAPRLSEDLLALLADAVLALSEPQPLPLAQIVQSFKDAGRLSIGAEEDDYHYGMQLLFITFGLVTGLFEPVLDPPKNTLLIETNQICSRPVIWVKDRITLESSANRLNIHVIIQSLSGRQGPIPTPSSMLGAQDVGHLRVSNVSFFTLTNFIQLEIVWTASACQHLEFDMRNKRLHLFCYPSLCSLICSQADSAGQARASFLESFFARYLLSARQRNDLHAATNNRPSTEYAQQFYREILESFRVIFGQEERAQKVFRRSAARKALQAFESHKPGDDMLYQLCSQPWNRQKVYDDIDSGPAKMVYAMHTDFPFLAERWMLLQDYVLSQAPNDWRSLYRDSRDPERFVAIWAVVVFGVLTLVFAIIQICLTIAQLGLQASQNGNGATKAA